MEKYIYSLAQNKGYAKALQAYTNMSEKLAKAKDAHAEQVERLKTFEKAFTEANTQFLLGNGTEEAMQKAKKALMDAKQSFENMALELPSLEATVAAVKNKLEESKDPAVAEIINTADKDHEKILAKLAKTLIELSKLYEEEEQLRNALAQVVGWQGMYGHMFGQARFDPGRLSNQSSFVNDFLGRIKEIGINL